MVVKIGGRGNDRLIGGRGNDRLIGGRGNDRLWGGSGNDRLWGGSGNDTLNGGTGIDTADYSNLGQAITLESVGVINKGSAGTDQIQFIEKIIGATGQANAIDGSTGRSKSTSLDIDLSANNLTVNGIPGIGKATFTIENFINVTGTSQNDTIIGNSADNLLVGGSGNDTLIGGSGNDRLVGGDGNDVLTGGSGNDRLVGGDGNDVLTGGSGNDKLTGGSGNDWFTFNSKNEGIDTISDFDVHRDLIRVDDRGFGGRLRRGTLDSSKFTLGSRARDSNDRFIYNKSTGDLFFDTDGTGRSAQVQIAKLSSGLNLSASDIVVF
ncbi:type I secretion target GGXGXDXXX repeat protein domain protein [Coleofasciculus chthonoplastes PCC 7420]|uniref:Type I secretion target GGXGXDXXX repeat protein domain protein n=1 Tax=Coleofasciculus chthonoplastes PCC 7420 TaxID=118168 RepID=B4W382_9CYAN|nr:calcium-binding protein [Coleofasciculus chthonoplastes]EDX71409.1 type I secretion target GGXGXDXXX repeat protein domain protein [Coleofasciculus chthonoplastes PCC 7420]